MPRNAATREIEHTGDVGIEVLAATREELFAEAIVALGRIMYETDNIRDRECRKLTVFADDDADLMHDALSAALNLFLIDAFLWRDANVIAISGGIEAELIGEPFDRSRHRLHEELKAVTYHRLAVERTPSGWRAVVIFDA